MSATTQLLDKYRKTRSLASDNAAAVSLGVHRATVSGWRQRGTQAEAHVVAQMAKAIGDEPGGWLALIESERARTEADRKEWAAVARRLGAAAAIFLAVALPLTSHAALSEQDQGVGIMRNAWKWLVRLFRMQPRHGAPIPSGHEPPALLA